MVESVPILARNQGDRVQAIKITGRRKMITGFRRVLLREV
jgi:hypothetical protein